MIKKPSKLSLPRNAIVIGGGPAGLMAAEALADAGVRVDLYDAMPSVGRKFLMAGKSGMNLTHSEARDGFLAKYGARQPNLEPAIDQFGADQLRAWAAELGVETFVGSSGRVFPTDFKAAPLLRAWLRRLRASGVTFHMRHRWVGWADNNALKFATPKGETTARAGATILALGGASWPKLGSTGAWVTWLQDRGVAVSPLKPANCAFEVDWSPHFNDRFAGQPVKAVELSFGPDKIRGDFVINQIGIEGGPVYQLSAPLRDAIAAEGSASLTVDLVPDRSTERITQALARPRKGASMSNHLRKAAGLKGVKAGLLNECLNSDTFANPATLAAGIKALPIRLTAPRPIDEAISSAGGVAFEDLTDAGTMVKAIPGLFCAGEMLDWEAPTGGYLLTACFALGRAAGQEAATWLKTNRSA